MKLGLKFIFTLFFIGILYATVRASLDRSVAAAITELWPDLWFKATIYDTYFAFSAIYLWIAYKETGLWRRVLWFFLIMLLGTFAFSAYILIQLSRLKKEDPAHKILLRTADTRS